MSERAQRRKGGGGREARRAARIEAKVPTVPYITRNVPCYEVMGEEGLAVIEAQAETILQEIGVEFRDDAEALQLWKEAGADIDGER
ncbi:MAG: trimethylamine methyltransferase family protein, partial [SAR324 cluster bacterium]|nr:trimethylamine methyltransferase family protein [SAR324 cluster bacterium]